MLTFADIWSETKELMNFRFWHVIKSNKVLIHPEGDLNIYQILWQVIEVNLFITTNVNFMVASLQFILQGTLLSIECLTMRYTSCIRDKKRPSLLCDIQWNDFHVFISKSSLKAFMRHCIKTKTDTWGMSVLINAPSCHGKLATWKNISLAYNSNS